MLLREFWSIWNTHRVSILWIYVCIVLPKTPLQTITHFSLLSSSFKTLNRISITDSFEKLSRTLNLSYQPMAFEAYYSYQG